MDGHLGQSATAKAQRATDRLNHQLDRAHQLIDENDAIGLQALMTDPRIGSPEHYRWDRNADANPIPTTEIHWFDYRQRHLLNGFAYVEPVLVATKSSAIWWAHKCVTENNDEKQDHQHKK